MSEKRIAMWSGPRNISTALMRSFENRSDTTVLDEPFYAYYLFKTGLNHPGRDLVLDSQSSNLTDVINQCIGEIPEGNRIWYQKHMAQHNLENSDLSWILNLKNCLLIRNPKDVILSFKKKFLIDTVKQLGYPQQVQIYDYIKKKTGEGPVIIDAKDILKHPEKILQKLCSSLDIPFSFKMLSWPKGGRSTDGVWSPFWYMNVEKTTKFKKYKKSQEILEPSLLNLYDESMFFYKRLFDLRIKP